MKNQPLSFFSPERKNFHPLRTKHSLARNRRRQKDVREDPSDWFRVLMGDIISPAPWQKGREPESEAICQGQRARAPALCAHSSSLPPGKQRVPDRPRGTPDNHTSAQRLGAPAASQRPAAGPLPPSCGEPTAAAPSTCEGRLRPAGLPPRLLAGLPPPIVNCDRSPSQRPARQIPRPLASSPPEPGLRTRRCHGASFFLVPSHGQRQETTAAGPELTVS